MFSRLNIYNYNDYEVLIVDSIGLLASLYAYADIAYIGGGFNASIHNILEPVVYGMPVLFGPNYHKSDEAKTLLNHPDWHAAFSIKDAGELTATIASLLANDGQQLSIGKAKSKEYVLNNTGGTEQIYQYIEGLNW